MVVAEVLLNAHPARISPEMKQRRLYSGRLALVAAGVLLVATWDLVAQPLVQETKGLSLIHI